MPESEKPSTGKPSLPLTPYEEIFKLIESRVKGKTVLDAGSELGDVSYIHSKSADVMVGVELERRFLTEAVRNHKKEKLHFIQGDLEHLGFFKDGSFDVIFSNYVLEHLANPQAFFREACRILKPKGTLIIITPNFLSPACAAAKSLPTPVVSRIKGSLAGGAEMHPLYYRANTVSRLDSMLSFNRFRRKVLKRFSGGALFSRSKTLFGIWSLGYRLSEIGALEVFKGTIYAEYERIEE